MLTPNQLTDRFQTSSGVLLLAMASALFLVNGTSPDDLVSPNDPILGVSMRTLYWIVGGMALVVSLDCLFGKKPLRPMFLLAWLATNFLVYRLGLISVGSHGLTGLLGGFHYTFGIPAKAANLLAQVTWGYLFIGSYGTLWWLVKQPKLDGNLLNVPCPACGGNITYAIQSVGQNLPCQHCQTILTLGSPQPLATKPARNRRSPEAFVRTLKIACTKCGGHIEFSTNSFGQQIACPHCKADIILQKAVMLKMSCAACDGHITFPAHAIGENISCPHCNNAITLKEPI